MAIRIGTAALVAAYLGSTAIDRIYLGADLLWPIAQTPATFVGSTSNTSASSSLSWPGGTAAGDIAIVVFGSGAATPPLSDTTWVQHLQGTGDAATTVHLAIKKLTAGDIASPPSYSTTNGCAAVYVYTGGNSVQVKYKASSAGTSLALTGFTKDATARKVVSVVCDRDPTSNPSTPAGMTGRARVSATYFAIEAADFDPEDYGDTDSVSWAGFVSSLRQAGFLLEITNKPQLGRYFAYGDSNTAGTLVPTAYPIPLNATLGLALTNKAVSGGMAGDMANASNSDTLRATDLSTILVGGNDQWHYGTDATKMGYYEDCLRRLVVNRAVMSRVNARDAGMTKTGTWANTLVNTFGMYANTSGAKCTCTVSGTSIYIGFILQASAGSATVKVDGNPVATMDCSGTGINTVLGSTYAAAAIRIDGLSSGAHTVEIETLSSAICYVDYVAGNAQTDTPAVWLSNLLKVISPSDPAGYYSSGRVETYNAIIDAVADDLIADGLNITKIDCFNALTSGDYQSDGIHPTAGGQLKMEDAFELAWA